MSESKKQKLDADNEDTDYLFGRNPACVTSCVWSGVLADSTPIDPKDSFTYDHFFSLTTHKQSGRDVFHWEFYNMVAEFLLQSRGLHLSSIGCNGKPLSWRDAFADTPVKHLYLPRVVLPSFIAKPKEMNRLHLFVRNKIDIQFVSTVRVTVGRHQLFDSLWEDITDFLQPGFKKLETVLGVTGWRERCATYIHSRFGSTSTEPLFLNHEVHLNVQALGQQQHCNLADSTVRCDSSTPNCIYLEQPWKVLVHTFSTFFTLEEWKEILNAAVDDIVSGTNCGRNVRPPFEEPEKLRALVLSSLKTGMELDFDEIGKLADDAEVPRLFVDPFPPPAPDVIVLSDAD